MIKLIRSNQKMFLTGLTIVAMITFVLNFGSRGGAGDHAVNDHAYGTINGKTVYASEAAEAHNELLALKNDLDIAKLEEQAQMRDPRAGFILGLIQAANNNNSTDWFMLLRHEANDSDIQVSNDDVETVLGTYGGDLLRNSNGDLNPDADNYPITRNAVSSLLKILGRYDQLASRLKVSKPAVDADLVRSSESLSLDLIQFKAADFLAAVPPPTTQQVQDQFTKFAAVEPHHPNPTTNPSGFGYRLPLRAGFQYVRITPEAVSAAVAATKFVFPAPDWEVQARKYYLANLSKFPATAPAILPTTFPTSAPTTAAIAAMLATTQPTGTLPFAVVHDQIVKEIQAPAAASLTDQVKDFIKTTTNTDWQAYSVFVIANKGGPEPVSSLGVPFTSPLYFAKLLEAVQTKFNVTLVTGETPGGLSAEQITALPVIGTSKLSDLVIAQATTYLSRIAAGDKSAPAWLKHPSDPVQATDPEDGTAKGPITFFRLSQVQPSEPAPNLASVQAQVETDVRNEAAYKLAQAKAKDVVTNLKDRPLFLIADSKNPLVHIDKLSMYDPKLPQITPELGAATSDFTTQAFELLAAYDPHSNRNPTTLINLPEQARAFAVQLTFVDASWNGENYFYKVLGIRRNALAEAQQVLRGEWYSMASVTKRLNFKPAAKNKGSDSE